MKQPFLCEHRSICNLATLSAVSVLWGCGAAPANEDLAEAQSAAHESLVAGPGPAFFRTAAASAAPSSARANAVTASSAATSGISYHGGPLMLGTTSIYYIWYGSWSNNTATSILNDLAANIGGSPYFNINTTYSDNTGVAVSNSVRFAGSTTDAYSQGTNLTDLSIQAVVSNAISSGRLPLDAKGVYFVLTSADVAQRYGSYTFCGNFCGWHNHGTISGSDVKYAFVGNPDRCPSACEASTSSPNGNAGADGMASVISHELEETVTDPHLDAWYDANGNENADKCAWNFGAKYTAPNGAAANVHLGSRDFLIQQNWVNSAAGFCAMSYSSPVISGGPSIKTWCVGPVLGPGARVVTWDAVPGATTYEVYQSSNAAFTNPSLYKSFGGTGFTLQPPFYDGGRYFAVRACNASGCGPLGTPTFVPNFC